MRLVSQWYKCLNTYGQYFKILSTSDLLYNELKLFNTTMKYKFYMECLMEVTTKLHSMTFSGSTFMIFYLHNCTFLQQLINF